MHTRGVQTKLKAESIIPPHFDRKEKMIRIVIVGVVADPLEYPVGSNSEAVEKDLLGGFGKGILKHNNIGVLGEALEAEEYEYHVTVQGKTSIICSVLYVVL